MTSPAKTIRAASKADLPAAAATLAAAFATYPWTRWSIPSEGYEARLERLQALYLTHAIEHGVVLQSADVTGVAALLPPDSPEPSERIQSQVAELLGDRLEATLALELPARAPNSWDLATIGVHPNHAGKGIGSALIREALIRISASNSPRVSLETSAESNVRLYQRHGFVVNQRSCVSGGPDVYSMSAEL